MGGCCFLFFLFFLVSMCRYIQRCICTLFITKMWCFGCFQVCHSQSRPSKWESNLHGSRCLSSTCQSPSRLWHISSYVSLQHFSVSQFCACKEFLVSPAVWSPLCRKLVWVASIYFLWQGWLYVGCRWRLWPRWHHGRSEACRRASPAACREPVEWPAVVTFDRLTRNKTKWALPSNLPYSHRHGLIPLVSLIFFQIAIMWNVHNGCDFFFFFFCFPAWKHACQWLHIVFICVISVCKRKYNAKPLMLQCYEKEVMVTHIVHAFSIDFKLIFCLNMLLYEVILEVECFYFIFSSL